MELAAIVLLAELFPSAFAAMTPAGPLKVGIRGDIVVKVNGAITEHSCVAAFCDPKPTRAMFGGKLRLVYYSRKRWRPRQHLGKTGQYIP